MKWEPSTEEVKVRFEQWTKAQQDELAGEIGMIACELLSLCKPLTMTFDQSQRIGDQIQRLQHISSMLYIPEKRPQVFR